MVPKKTPGEYRLIHDLSFPRGDSVNDAIAPEHASVQYARVDDAVAIIKQLGSGCFLAKTDIKSAFRILPIKPSDYDLLVFFGKVGIIMIVLCPWDVRHPVVLLRCLALLSIGLLRNTCQSRI